MAIMESTARFLIDSKKAGVCFDHTVTLGRVNLYESPFVLEKLLRSAGLVPDDLSPADVHGALAQDPYYADPFLSFLGTKRLSTLDVSDYEGADVLHDMNSPIPESLHEQFDTLFDSGTLEHVFRVDTALKNCMEMVKVGGHALITVPANNYCGHGFYQFSPELFYRVFTPKNGYEIEQVTLFETDVVWPRLLGRYFVSGIHGRAFDVTDPNSVRQRILLVNNRPVMIQVRARRTRRAAIFATVPQQSDYMTLWDANDKSKDGESQSTVPKKGYEGYRERIGAPARLHLEYGIVGRLLERWLPFYHAKVYGYRSFKNRLFYTPRDR